MPLVGRGVWSRSYLSPGGFEVLVAVDWQSRLVGEYAVREEEDRLTALQMMWTLLDAADPTHARRQTSRDLEKQLAS